MVTNNSLIIKDEGKFILQIRKFDRNLVIVLPFYATIINVISSRDLEKQFIHLSADRLDCLLEIHRMVAQVSPEAVAEIRRYGIVYYNPAQGGPVSAGICQALFKPDYIRLAFIHGAFLHDPEHLLQGETFPKRYLKITCFDEAPWEAIFALIAAHAQFDPRKLPQNSSE